ncbi:MAG: CRISPR system precrRNA processing endoribonuclease RAMP protein Cas6 [Thermodesulfovibrionales bacterium]|nr:CRISPR system precrRNA processing endoribonuclease RAMP protein Cas6 [Thermodesulfovibrionales bacterium]
MASSYFKQSLEGFCVRSLLLTMQARQDIELGNPYSQGDKWRGGFGQSLRQICCLNPFAKSDCNTCLKKAECFYYFFFAIDIPHPYIIETDTSTKSPVVEGQTMTVKIKLIGIASKETEKVILAFKRLEQVGIGAKRGRFELISVHSLDMHIQDLFKQNLHTKSLVLQLETPLKLKQGQGELNYDQFNFENFFRLLLKRIINLNNIYGNGKDFDKQTIQSEKDFLLTRAQDIQTQDAIRWIDLERYSSRQSKRLKIGGIIGAVTLKGDLDELYPFLKIGEVIHAGIHTTSGFGRYRII